MKRANQAKYNVKYIDWIYFILFFPVKIGGTEDLKCLFVLLIQQYNPNIHNKQYLQDLIITNHILLLFLDNVYKLPEYKGNTNLMDHIKQ